jgi:hypothetical protein
MNQITKISSKDVEIVEEELELGETDRQNIAAFFDREILPNSSLGNYHLMIITFSCDLVDGIPITEVSHEVADRHRDTAFEWQNPDDEVEIENGRPPFHDDPKDYIDDDQDMVDNPHKQEEDDPSMFPEDIELEYKDVSIDEQPPTIMMGHGGEEGKLKLYQCGQRVFLLDNGHQNDIIKHLKQFVIIYLIF